MSKRKEERGRIAVMITMRIRTALGADRCVVTLPFDGRIIEEAHRYAEENYGATVESVQLILDDRNPGPA
jgi:hypothetical protein